MHLSQQQVLSAADKHCGSVCLILAPEEKSVSDSDNIKLLCVVSVSVKNKHQSATESSPDTQKLTKEANVSALLATINNLKEQNKQLWARLNATKGTCQNQWLCAVV